MTTKKSDTNGKSAGEKMMAALKKKGPLTTEQLSEIVGLSLKDTYSRAWWLQRKEGLLKSTGHGKTRTWTLSVRGLKSVNPPAEA